MEEIQFPTLRLDIIGVDVEPLLEIRNEMSGATEKHVGRRHFRPSRTDTRKINFTEERRAFESHFSEFAGALAASNILVLPAESLNNTVLFTQSSADHDAKIENASSHSSPHAEAYNPPCSGLHSQISPRSTRKSKCPAEQQRSSPRRFTGHACRTFFFLPPQQNDTDTTGPSFLTQLLSFCAQRKWPSRQSG